MNIIFAGTPEFAVAPLLALIKGHNVVAVFTQPDRRSGRGKKLSPPPVKVVAEEHNIPVFQPTTLADQQPTVAALQADVMVVVAYGMLLPQDILDTPRLGCINIHASILPRWRGAAPIQRAIEAGDAQTGVSIMQMDAGLDTGAVYEILTVAIDATDTSASLHDKLAELGARGIVATLDTLHTNPETPATPQSEQGVSYARKISKDEARVDWKSSASEINNKIRAFDPWPVCQTHHQHTRIRLWQSTVLKQKGVAGSAGTVLSIDDQGISVACGDGVLRLEKLQRDGSKPLQAREFCNGYELTPGSVLGDQAG
ncbi:MAG: methionyl-tRNA formyltransferase [Pseudomonadota bacterium]